MRVVTVVGARPQFVKAAPVGQTLREGHIEILVHTGQHQEHGMSQVFFDELDMPEPDVNLGIGSGGDGRQTGEMLIGLEEVLLVERPGWVLIAATPTRRSPAHWQPPNSRSRSPMWRPECAPSTGPCRKNTTGSLPITARRASGLP
jgi:UDP-N-acetylglucosamine 2-epimerase